MSATGDDGPVSRPIAVDWSVLNRWEEGEEPSEEVEEPSEEVEEPSEEGVDSGPSGAGRLADGLERPVVEKQMLEDLIEAWNDGYDVPRGILDQLHVDIQEADDEVDLDVDERDGTRSKLEYDSEQLYGSDAITGGSADYAVDEEWRDGKIVVVEADEEIEERADEIMEEGGSPDTYAQPSERGAMNIALMEAAGGVLGTDCKNQQQAAGEAAGVPSVSSGPLAVGATEQGVIPDWEAERILAGWSDYSGGQGTDLVDDGREEETPRLEAMREGLRTQQLTGAWTQGGDSITDNLKENLNQVADLWEEGPEGAGDEARGG